MPGKHVRALAAMIRGEAIGFPNADWLMGLDDLETPEDLLLIARASAAGSPVYLGQWEINPSGVDGGRSFLEENEISEEELDEEHRVIFANNAGGLELISAFDSGSDEAWLYLVDPEYRECRMLDSIETWLARVVEGDDRAGKTGLQDSEDVAELARRVAELPDEPDEDEAAWIDGSAGLD